MDGSGLNGLGELLAILDLVLVDLFALVILDGLHNILRAIWIRGLLNPRLCVLAIKLRTLVGDFLGRCPIGSFLGGHLLSDLLLGNEVVVLPQGGVRVVVEAGVLLVLMVMMVLFGLELLLLRCFLHDLPQGLLVLLVLETIVGKPRIKLFVGHLGRHLRGNDLIVLLPELLVANVVVGFTDSLELGLGVLAAGLVLGVVLQGQFPESIVDLLCAGVLLDAQHLVVVLVLLQIVLFEEFLLVF